MTQTSLGQTLIPQRFEYRDPDARNVTLLGSFNGWDPVATPMRRKTDGLWIATVRLQPGRHEYKYLVDGEWRRETTCEELDRDCPHCVPNNYGTMNCVLEL